MKLFKFYSFAHPKVNKFLIKRYFSNKSEYRSVVGLEVHAQIKADAKLFSKAAAQFGGPTNSNVSYFDAALPGTLPALNIRCVEAAILTALALNCQINNHSKFDRKHYFYPDLPSGYQITQQFEPLACNGSIRFVMPDRENGAYECQSNLKQLQLEQDSGKSFHLEDKSLVDLNRAGIGLMELVFEPDLRTGAEAAALVKELIHILKRLDTCTCEMEKGTLRVDANISVHKLGDPFGVRTEVKNINSMRYIARAIDYEVQRQIEVLQSGQLVINETRAYDYSCKKTVFMRDKEMLQDYRFMPEPNLPPIEIYSGESEEQPNVDKLRQRLPLLPEFERSKLVKEHGIALDKADALVNLKGFRQLFEEIVAKVPYSSAVCTFLLNIFQHNLHTRKITFEDCLLSPSQVSDVIQLAVSKTISEATANDILEMLLNGDDRSPKEIVDMYNWFLIWEEKDLEPLCREVIKKMPKVARRFGRSQRRHDISTLLVALNEKAHNRVSIPDAEAMFRKLIMPPES